MENSDNRMQSNQKNTGGLQLDSPPQNQKGLNTLAPNQHGAFENQN